MSRPKAEFKARIVNLPVNKDPKMPQQVIQMRWRYQNHVVDMIAVKTATWKQLIHLARAARRQLKKDSGF